MMQRVLYVDDDEALAELAALLLQSAGVAVLTCGDGHEAVAAIENFAPDLLLLDKEMPEMDGPQTLAALRAVPGFAATPAIFMTADHSAETQAALKACGALAVVSKPIDPGSFVSTLAGCFEGA